MASMDERMLYAWTRSSSRTYHLEQEGDWQEGEFAVGAGAACGCGGPRPARDSPGLRVDLRLQGGEALGGDDEGLLLARDVGGVPAK